MISLSHTGARAHARTHTHTHTHSQRPPERREITAGCHPFRPQEVDYMLHSPVQVNDGPLSLLPSHCPRAEGCTCHPGGPLALLSVQLQPSGTIFAVCPANRRGCLSPEVWPEKLTTSFFLGQGWIFRPTRGKQHPGALATTASPPPHPNTHHHHHHHGHHGPAAGLQAWRVLPVLSHLSVLPTLSEGHKPCSRGRLTPRG